MTQYTPDFGTGLTRMPADDTPTKANKHVKWRLIGAVILAYLIGRFAVQITIWHNLSCFWISVTLLSLLLLFVPYKLAKMQ